MGVGGVNKQGNSRASTVGHFSTVALNALAGVHTCPNGARVVKQPARTLMYIYHRRCELVQSAVVYCYRSLPTTKALFL